MRRLSPGQGHRTWHCVSWGFMESAAHWDPSEAHFCSPLTPFSPRFSRQARYLWMAAQPSALPAGSGACCQLRVPCAPAPLIRSHTTPVMSHGVVLEQRSTSQPSGVEHFAGCFAALQGWSAPGQGNPGIISACLGHGVPAVGVFAERGRAGCAS